MALSLNRVMLAGNLTRDPQVRFLASEKAVAEFGLAINRRFKDKDGQNKEEVTFVDVETWGRTAELVGQYLTKGRACYIEGRLKFDSWEDKEGQKRSKLKVVADNVQFLDSRAPGERPAGGEAAEAPAGGKPAAASAPAPSPAASPVTDDEPPF
jgi:single-strand DNA-binding protein